MACHLRCQRSRAVVIASRWPNGFECPVCGCRQHSVVTTRDLYQCTRCRRQLGRRLGVTQTTAWKIKHKLKQVMLERDASKRLAGRIEIDDAYLGGERHGGKRGRGAPGKTPFVAAVETTAEGKPVRLKLRRVTSFCAASIAGFAKRSLDPDCAVVSDGLQCPASPMPGARIRLSRPGRDRRRHARRRSNGSTPRWATSRPPSQEPAIRSGCDDPTAHMGRRPNRADALSAPEIG